MFRQSKATFGGYVVVLAAIFFAVVLQWNNSAVSYFTADSVTAGEKMRLRSVKTAVLSRWQGEGRGARVRRSIGRPELRYHIYDFYRNVAVLPVPCNYRYGICYLQCRSNSF
jgi:hypothetical protein